MTTTFAQVGGCCPFAAGIEHDPGRNPVPNDAEVISIRIHGDCNLRTVFRLWYVTGMRKSYIGILNQSGLDTLLPEENHIDRFLLRRAMRENAVCFWAVIDDSVYVTIRQELAFGQKQNAARLLQLLAIDSGAILPPHNVGMIGIG